MEMKSFEEILAARLSTPVVNKKDGKEVLPMEAMVASVVREAIGGSIQHIAFIRNITRQRQSDPEATREKHEQLKNAYVSRLREEFAADGLYIGQDTELAMLAENIMLLDMLNEQIADADFQPIVTETRRDGSQSMSRNPVLTLRDEQQKRVQSDMKQLRQEAMARIQNRKILKSKK